MLTLRADAWWQTRTSVLVLLLGCVTMTAVTVEVPKAWIDIEFATTTNAELQNLAGEAIQRVSHRKDRAPTDAQTIIWHIRPGDYKI